MPTARRSGSSSRTPSIRISRRRSGSRTTSRASPPSEPSVPRTTTDSAGSGCTSSTGSNRAGLLAHRSPTRCRTSSWRSTWFVPCVLGRTAPELMADVSFRDVGKVFPDGTRAVSHLDLEIDDGEFMVLVGPSGCGKTTALRMVGGLEDVSEGEITIAGRSVNDLSPQERDIAMVFQNYALYPHMSVFDNIAFPLRAQRVPRAERKRRVEDVARLLELSEQLKRRPRNLSGGQRQRVAMGRALIRQPQVFLMDEPLSNLDAKLRVEMRGEIAALQQKLGVT